MTIPARILVPVDFSPASDAALDYAIALAKHAGASVDLLHVSDPPLDSLATFSATSRGAQMRECLSRLEREGVPAHGRLETGDPSRAINRCSANGDYDLIVIGAHDASGRSWRSMAFHVVERVVRGARCPVLAFHGAPAISASHALSA
jgi:nucleotide-binding universal stress UspA family protein